jgi:hypothetical protein
VKRRTRSEGGGTKVAWQVLQSANPTTGAGPQRPCRPDSPQRRSERDVAAGLHPEGGDATLRDRSVPAGVGTGIPGAGRRLESRGGPLWDLHAVGPSRCGTFTLWDLHAVGPSRCGTFTLWDLQLGAVLPTVPADDPADNRADNRAEAGPRTRNVGRRGVARSDALSTPHTRRRCSIVLALECDSEHFAPASRLGSARPRTTSRPSLRCGAVPEKCQTACVRRASGVVLGHGRDTHFARAGRLRRTANAHSPTPTVQRTQSSADSPAHATRPLRSALETRPARADTHRRDALSLRSRKST